MRSLRFRLPIQLFGLLIITTANVEAFMFMSFFTAQIHPSPVGHDHDNDDLTKHASHNPNLRLEAVHVLKSMHSNCPHDDDDNSDTGGFVNPYSAMFQRMGVARDTKKSSDAIDIMTELSDGLRRVTAPPGSSKKIHSGLVSDELRSVTPPSTYSTSIHIEKDNEVEGRLRSMTPPPGSSNAINSEGLRNSVLRNYTPPGSSISINNESNELGRLRDSTPPHDSSKSIQPDPSSPELSSVTKLQGVTPPPGSSGTIN